MGTSVHEAMRVKQSVLFKAVSSFSPVECPEDIRRSERETDLILRFPTVSEIAFIHITSQSGRFRFFIMGFM